MSRVGLNELRGVRAAIQALYQLIEPDFIIPDSASYRSQTNTFCKGPMTPEKIDFLVHHGFPQICALSYFFEENYLGKKQIVIANDRVMRAHTEWSLYSLIGHHDITEQGELRVGSFKIEPRHVLHFPVVIYPDEDSGVFCWPMQAPKLTSKKDPQQDGFVKITYEPDPNHFHADVNMLSKLDANPVAVEKSYQTFLKIALVPNPVFLEILKKYLSGPALFLVFEKICLKKGALQNTLKTVKKFSDWHHHQSCITVFKNKQTTEFTGDFFCQMIEENVKACLSSLSAFLALSTPELASGVSALSAMNPYTPFVGLRAVLMESCQAFFQENNKSVHSIAMFIAQLKQLLQGFQQFNFFVHTAQSEKLNEVYQQLQKIIFQLSRDFDLTNHQLSSILETHLTASKDAAVLVTTAATSDALAQELLSWLQHVDPVSSEFQNRRIILFILNETYRQHEEKRLGLFRKASSVLASASSLWSSSSRFFFNTSSRHFTAQTPPSMLKELVEKVSTARDVTQFMAALQALLSCKEMDVVLFAKEFVRNLVSQFIAELSAKDIVHDMQNNAAVAVNFTERLSVLSKLYCSEEIENVFVQRMQPRASSVCNDVAEWVDCSFTTESVPGTQERKTSTEPAVSTEPVAANENAVDQLETLMEDDSIEVLDFSDLKPCCSGAAA